MGSFGYNLKCLKVEYPFVPLLVLLGFFLCPSSHSKLVQNEVDALQQIVHTMGATYWQFDDVSCQIKMVGMTPQSPLDAESNIECSCLYENNTCHVVSIVLKGYNLPGVLPPELVKLPYLQHVDFVYNFLSGGIPVEWATLQLKYISLLVNRLSGEIPKVLGNMTSLTYLNLEANQFTGRVPNELGKLYNLGSLILSSNQFTGMLPVTLGRLGNLTDFRINDNNFVGAIPSYIQNWQQLTRLEMHGSGLHGPIPFGITLLNQVTQFRMSDIDGTTQGFPAVSHMTGLVRLVLRNCSIAGEIPGYIWRMNGLQMLDVSYNNLVGVIPDNIGAKDLKFIFLMGNQFSGNVPASLLKDGRNIDLSYNNFTWQDSTQPTCQQNMNFNINLFRSSFAGNNLKGLLPCSKAVDCPQ